MNKKHLLIFQHIHKTGGTTLTTVLKRYFRFNKIFPRIVNYDAGIKEIEKTSISRRKEIQYLLGHILFGVHKYFTQQSKYIAFMRNPIDCILSSYFHSKYITHGGNYISLEKYIEHYDNPQTRVFIGKHVWSKDVLKKDNLIQAENNIRKHYILIGITEKFDLSLMLLSRPYNFEIDKLLYRRELKNKDRLKKEEIPDAVIKRIEKKTEYDRILYDMFLEKLNIQCRKYSIDESGILKNFMMMQKDYTNFCSFFTEFTSYFFADLIWLAYQHQTNECRVLIYGTGTAGKATLEFIDKCTNNTLSKIKIIGFIDSRTQKKGSSFCGYKVSNPDSTILKDADYILIASLWQREIYNNLVKLNIPLEKIYPLGIDEIW